MLKYGLVAIFTFFVTNLNATINEKAYNKLDTACPLNTEYPKDFIQLTTGLREHDTHYHKLGTAIFGKMEWLVSKHDVEKAKKILNQFEKFTVKMRKAKRKNPFSKKKKFYIKLTLERKGGVIKHVKVYPKACIYTLTTRPNPKKKDVLDGYTFTYKALG